MANVTDRVEAAKDKADAEKWREAEGQGRAVADWSLVAAVDRDYLRRDRMGLDAGRNGRADCLDRDQRACDPRLRWCRRSDGFGLVSGYRRLEAFVSPWDLEEIPAFVRIGQEGAAAYVSMIEENELRADLSPYERGRIAVLVAGQGVFGSVEEAVDAHCLQRRRGPSGRRCAVLPPFTRRLGDMLSYPKFQISERLGLKLATALRSMEGRSALALCAGG